MLRSSSSLGGFGVEGGMGSRNFCFRCNMHSIARGFQRSLGPFVRVGIISISGVFPPSFGLLLILESTGRIDLCRVACGRPFPNVSPKPVSKLLSLQGVGNLSGMTTTMMFFFGCARSATQFPHKLAWLWWQESVVRCRQSVRKDHERW